MARAKILGGKEKHCPMCGGTVLTIRIGKDIYYNCKECGMLTRSYQEDEIIIYREEVELVGGMARY